MQTIFLTGIKQMELGNSPNPEINHPGEVIIKILAVGVCGSDVHYYSEGKIGSQVVKYPFAVGHECSGEIVAVGKEVTNVKVGDLVVVEPSVHCGVCDQCLSGRPHTCRNVLFLGCPGQLDGCLSEYIKMPAKNCFPVTGNLKPVEAALVEPLTIGVYAVKLAEINNKAQATGIFGAGPIGLSVLLNLLARGIKNTAIFQPLEYRRQKATQLGARYTTDPSCEDIFSFVREKEPLLLDTVFEASGEQAAVDNAIKILKPGGKLVLIGIPPSAKYIFDMDLLRRKEITIINVRRQNYCVEEAISLIQSGKADMAKMVTHFFPLKQTPAAFDIVEGYKDGVIKAMIML